MVNEKKNKYKKRHSDKLPPFVALTWGMLNSQAYKNLSYAAAKALPYFLGKFKGSYRDPQRYLFEFPLSYREAERYKFSPSTFHKVIRRLISYGFIDPVEKGGLRSDGKSYNLFKLSERWEQYGTGAFEQKDWECFFPRLKPRATPKSETYSFKKGNKKAEISTSISKIEAVEVF